MQNVDSQNRWVLMTVDGQSYALPLAAVDRILRMVEVTPLPGAPDVVEGVIDIQGQVVPVVSIRRRLGLTHRPVEISDSLVLAHARSRRLAVIACAPHGRENPMAVPLSVEPDSLLLDQLVPQFPVLPHESGESFR